MWNGISVPFLLHFLSRIGSGWTSVVSKHYTYFEQCFTWEEAHNFCRQDSRSNLAIFYKQSDVDNLWLQQYHAWVSLNTKNVEKNHWDKWWPKIFNIHKKNEKNESESTDGCAAINFDYRSVDITDCEDRLFFICENNKNNQNRYKFIPKAKNWSDAHWYCKHYKYDLAHFNFLQYDALFNERDFPVWVGVQMEGGPWNWTTDFSEYMDLTLNESRSYGDCVSISSLTKKMEIQNCEAHFPFVCISENVVLVKENQTWEEALEYCQNLSLSNTSSLRFQLLSFEPGDDHDYVMREVMKAETDEVWTGLRFLAGEWLWVNGEEMLYPDLPLCPTPGHYCGALLKNDTGSVEERDCSERKNFLCYSYSEQHWHWDI